jgi:hypothetical protein
MRRIGMRSILRDRSQVVKEIREGRFEDFDGEVFDDLANRH